MDQILRERGLRIAQTASDIHSEQLRRLFIRWQNACIGQYPRPVAFDPVDFPADAPHWAWIEVVDEGQDFIARFVGTEIVRLHGFETTGRRLSETTSDIGRVAAARLADIFGITYREQRPIVAGPQRSALTEKEWMWISSITLPISSDGDHIDRLLIAIDVQ